MSIFDAIKEGLLDPWETMEFLFIFIMKLFLKIYVLLTNWKLVIIVLGERCLLHISVSLKNFTNVFDD